MLFFPILRLRRLTPLLAGGLLLTASYARAQAPANDDCATATALPVAPVGGPCTPLTATNQNATASAGVAAPSCGDYQGGDVWFALTVPASGAVQLSTSAVAGSPVTDTQLALYRGSCGSLTELACNDDFNGRFSQVQSGGLVAGEVLYLRASSYGNAQQGAFGVCAQALPACAPPTNVAVTDVGPARATVRFTRDALAGTYVITYTPAGGSPQTVRTSGPSQTLTNLRPATTYALTVASDCGGSQPASAPVAFTTGPPLANDDCAGAVPLAVGLACTAPTQVMVDGASASLGVADPSCANYQGGDVWFTLTVPANGIVVLETSEVADDPAFDTGLAVYSGACGSLSEVQCDDDGSRGSYSYLRLSGRPAGEVLYVRAWVAGGGTRPFALCATTDDAQPLTTWTGTANSDWFDAANWTAGVPTATTNARVPAVAGSAPVLGGGALAQVHTLSIEKYSAFRFAGGTLAVSGNLLNRSDDARFLVSSAIPYTGGVLALRGAAPQQVSGVGELFDLQMNSTSTAVLTTPLRLDHFLTMDGGVLSTGLVDIELYHDNPFAGELFSNARLVHESETSYVLGRIQTRRFVDAGAGPEDFSGLGFTLSSRSGSTAPDLTRLTRYTGVAQSGVGSRPGVLRAYNAEPGTDTGLDLTLDLHYFAHERNGLADADLRPYSSSGGLAGPWALEPGSTRLAPPAPDSASTIRLTSLTHLSGWTLGAAASPLPVALTSFTAEAAGPDALLRWATASEQNNAFFEPEVSADGRIFTALARVPGHGTSTQPHTYQLRDAQVARHGAGLLYYRLRQQDAGGAASYSPVRTLAVAAPLPAAVAYPNPFTHTLTVQATATAAGPATVVLRDATGRELLHQTTSLAAPGRCVLPIAGASQLPTGFYLLTLSLPGQPPVQLHVSHQ